MVIISFLAWSSKKQQIVARSSIESEYKDLVDTAAKLSWLVLGSINLVFLFLILQYFSVTKHVEIYFPFVPNKVAYNALEFRFISNKDQLADIMTKARSSPRFIFLCVKLKLSLWEPLTWGGILRDLPNLICCIFIFVGTFEYYHLYIFYILSCILNYNIIHTTLNRFVWMINSSKPPCASISDICFLFAGFSFGVKSIHLLLAKKKKKPNLILFNY